MVELFCEPDGTFPGRSPNPSVAGNLRELQRVVRLRQADIGVAYDGDGDRAVFVDELGRVVESDHSIVLFARHLLSQCPGKVIYDLKCSSVVPEAVRAHSTRVVRLPLSRVTIIWSGWRSSRAEIAPA